MLLLFFNHGSTYLWNCLIYYVLLISLVFYDWPLMIFILFIIIIFFILLFILIISLFFNHFCLFYLFYTSALYCYF